ncbi:hypothetical protein H920_08967 [Fukomys damarensis]|uniref:Uncharacterized protein n=1 Tax=Fukomys damarensis TaxID=885580 RepID=A0A091DHA5_FUKDA|nr:hypothetical protein H920_08967 [Fukomys damarensis]
MRRPHHFQTPRSVVVEVQLQRLPLHSRISSKGSTTLSSHPTTPSFYATSMAHVINSLKKGFDVNTCPEVEESLDLLFELNFTLDPELHNTNHF